MIALAVSVFGWAAASTPIVDESPLVVFQGEVAVVDCKNGEHCLIKTTKQQTCHVLVLHSASNNIGVLAHFDEFVDVKGSLRWLEKNLEERTSSRLRESFKATLIAGHERYEYFRVRERLILEALKEAGIEVKVIRLTQRWESRPQILLNAKVGNITQLSGDDVNERLECLQKREYGYFYAYQGKEEDDRTPEFCLSRATRRESVVPESEYLMDCSITMDTRSVLQLPIRRWRSPCEPESDCKNSLH